MKQYAQLSIAIVPFNLQASEEREGQLAAKDARYEDLHQKHEAMKRDNVEELDKKDRHHVQVPCNMRTSTATTATL